MYNKTESKASFLFFFWLVTRKVKSKRQINITVPWVKEKEQINKQSNKSKQNKLVPCTKSVIANNNKMYSNPQTTKAIQIYWWCRLPYSISTAAYALRLYDKTLEIFQVVCAAWPTGSETRLCSRGPVFDSPKGVFFFPLFYRNSVQFVLLPSSLTPPIPTNT